MQSFDRLLFHLAAQAEVLRFDDTGTPCLQESNRKGRKAAQHNAVQSDKFHCAGLPWQYWCFIAPKERPPHVETALSDECDNLVSGCVQDLTVAADQ